jgi:AhpD family alkylhydroperoxidase
VRFHPLRSSPTVQAASCLGPSGQWLREQIPGVFEGYGALSSAVLGDGALDAKTKELIALAIAVTKQCDGCMASHARGAARRGATAEEVAEALGVAIQMGGGPSMNYAADALRAFDQFHSEI